MISMAKLLPRLRSKADIPLNGKDTISQDGTSYVIELGSKPILPDSESIFLTHSTFTTGIPQQIPRLDILQTFSPVPTGVSIAYTINNIIGEVKFYQGTGVYINSGLQQFAPWESSNVTAYYQYTKYTDRALTQYISYAVASVEAALQLGMYVSGASGVAPYPERFGSDFLGYLTDKPYLPEDKMVIVEDLEILQEVITQRAAVDISVGERRVSSGDAIRLKDGDTEIDTSVNQRYLSQFGKEIKDEYDSLINRILIGMSDGYNLKQIDEMPTLYLGGGALARVEGYPIGY